MHKLGKKENCTLEVRKLLLQCGNKECFKTILCFFMIFFSFKLTNKTKTRKQIDSKYIFLLTLFFFFYNTTDALLLFYFVK